MIPNYERITTEHDNKDVKRYVTSGISCNINHRSDGPAIYGLDGKIFWCVYGKFYIVTRKYCDACAYSPEETVMMLLKCGERLPSHTDDYRE